MEEEASVIKYLPRERRGRGSGVIVNIKLCEKKQAYRFTQVKGAKVVEGITCLFLVQRRLKYVLGMLYILCFILYNFKGKISNARYIF